MAIGLNPKLGKLIRYWKSKRRAKQEQERRLLSPLLSAEKLNCAKSKAGRNRYLVAAFSQGGGFQPAEPGSLYAGLRLIGLDEIADALRIRFCGGRGW